MLLPALGRDWDVDLIAPAVDSVPAPRSGFVGPRYPQFVRTAVQYTLLEKEELWSIRRFLGWKPRCAAALLIASPFAPVVYAARRLARAGIPYIVDVGDPWVLTEQESFARGPALRRSERAERRLWAGAAGVVVTTSGQAEALAELVRDLPLLVRPNGYDPAGRQAFDDTFADAVPRDSATLRLAHFGTIYNLRLDVGPVLARLVNSGSWDRIELHQFGTDYLGALRDVPGIDITFHERRPWTEIVALSTQYDAAFVVGNEDPVQLPSKVVDYLVLPIPRVAVSSHSNDAMSRYLADKPGWLTLRPDTPDAASLLEAHITHAWTREQLGPPRSEEWTVVADEVAGFVKDVLLHTGLRRRSSAAGLAG